MEKIMKQQQSFFWFWLRVETVGKAIIITQLLHSEIDTKFSFLLECFLEFHFIISKNRLEFIYGIIYASS